MNLGSKRRLLSIILNNEFIKICELTKNGKTIIVHKTVTVPTPPRSYSDGIVKDRGALCKVIKVALDDNRITTTDVVFSISSNKIATKEVIIPNVKANKIGNIIMTNVSGYFPVNIDEHIIQYSVLERFDEEGQTKIKVLVMAAPSDFVETFYNLASSIGLHVEAIDYLGNSTSQALKHQIDKIPCLVIQIENDATIVNIFRNNVLELQRTIPYGKSVLVNTLMDKYHIRYESAMKKLQTEEYLHKNFDGDEITESLHLMVSNINRIMDFYVSRNDNKTIEKAYIIGNATTILGFNELFANEIHLPLECIAHINGVVLDKKTYVDETTLTSYISNIGAVIDPVNFVPNEIDNKQKKQTSNNLEKIFFIVCLIAAIVIVAIPVSQMASVKANLEMVKSSNESKKDIEKIVDDYYYAKDMDADASSFSAVTAGANDKLQEFLTDFEEACPSAVEFSSLQIANGSLSVSGETDGKITLAALIQQMRSIEGVSDVVVGSEAESKDNAGNVKVTFSLSCKVSR